jgi:hypothetical protein
MQLDGFNFNPIRWNSLGREQIFRSNRAWKRYAEVTFLWLLSAIDMEALSQNWEFRSRRQSIQISDHLPLWLELKTDIADAYLAKVMRDGSSRSSARRELPRPPKGNVHEP